MKGGSQFENLSLGEARPSSLIQRYEALYAGQRLDVLDELCVLPGLEGSEQLVQDLLASVIQVMHPSLDAPEHVEPCQLYVCFVSLVLLRKRYAT